MMRGKEKEAEGIVTPVVACILVTETGERFAFYGFRAILVLYLVHDLHYAETVAIALFAYTTSLAYLSPLLGALLADGPWGRYRTILNFSLVYVAGLAILTVAAWFDYATLTTKRALTIVGLILVCLGTGGIKPCVSAFGADQVAALDKTIHFNNNKDSSHGDDGEPDGRGDGIIMAATGEETDGHQEERVRTFFAYFYFCINVGAGLSIVSVPIVKHYFSYGPAFSLSLLFMILAVSLFASKRHQYHHLVKTNDDNNSLAMTLRLCLWLLHQNAWQHPRCRRLLHQLPCLEPGPCPKKQSVGYAKLDTADSDGLAAGGFDGDGDMMEDPQLLDAAKVLHVIPILLALPIYYCLYDQQGSVWTLQATKMELHGLQPEQLNVVNCVQVMLFIPLFERVIYPALTRARCNIAPIRRMSWGMFVSALAFVMSGLLESWIQQSADDDDQTKVSVFWQLPQITALSFGEILVSVTGLEFAYGCATDRVKTLIMALFLLTTAGGDLLSGLLYSTVFAEMDRAVVMHVCAALLLINLVAFSYLTRWWEGRRATDLLRGLSTASRAAVEEEGLELNPR